MPVAVQSGPLWTQTHMNSNRTCGERVELPLALNALSVSFIGYKPHLFIENVQNLTSSSGNSIAWSTSWSWVSTSASYLRCHHWFVPQTGGYNVKSYSNIKLKSGNGEQLSAISSMPVRWFITLTSCFTILWHLLWCVSVNLEMVTSIFWCNYCWCSIRSVHIVFAYWK